MKGICVDGYSVMTQATNKLTGLQISGYNNFIWQPAFSYR
jgi:hypothetical protein